MTLLPHGLDDAELPALAERAMRHAATIFSEMTGCRRRACRRNGCCGAMVKNGCLKLPGGVRVEPARFPPCMIGADPDVVASLERRARTCLELLLCDPGYNLHSGRLQRTFGKSGSPVSPAEGPAP